MSLMTFERGGVHPPEHKALSEKAAIEEVPLPKTFIVSVHQNLGAPSKAIVKKKEEVKAGQIIAEATGFVSVPVHAPTSGVVKKVEEYPTSTGARVMCIEIAADGEDTWVDTVLTEPKTDVDLGDAKALKDAVVAAGLVGMGGAAFPTHVKLSPPKDVTIDALLLNGVECEPYLTADQHLMEDKANEVLMGAQVFQKILGVERVYVGIEANKPEAIRIMTEAAKGFDGMSVHALEVMYPQGAEKQLIKSILDREVPPGKLPMHVGCVVQNVGTCFAAYEAIYLNKPLVERITTVTGKAIARPANLKTRIGMQLSHLVEHCGGTTDGLQRIVMGGPMMGKAITSLELPVLKATSGLLFLTDEETPVYEELDCIRCGRCVDHCPMGLVPCDLATMAEMGVDDERLMPSMSCVECGSCAFACPAKRRLVHWIRLGKFRTRELMKRTG